MVGRYGSLSRSLLSAARSSAVNSPRLRPPSVSTPRLHRRRPGPRFPASTTRNWGEFGAVYSFLPLGEIVKMGDGARCKVIKMTESGLMENVRELSKVRSVIEQSDSIQ